MNFIIPLWGGLMGLVVGSFLNVVIRRGVRGETLRGRSHCEACGTTLASRDLIPVISFIILRGRCRHCSAPFSFQYPLVELAAGLVFGFTAWNIPPVPVTLPALIHWLTTVLAASALIVAFVTDWQYKIIPNGSVATLFMASIVALTSRAVQWEQGIGRALLYDIGFAVGLALFFAALWFLSDGTWMGLGDAKLFLPLGLILGFPASLIAFLLSFWLGGLWGGSLLILRKNSLKDTIPFGPFIIIGAALAYFYTDSIIGLTRLL